MINFRKPRPGEVAPALAITGDEDAATFAEKARAILVDALERHPGASADRLYDELVSRMVRRGEFERHNFEELLAQVAEPVREPVMRNLLDPTPPDLFGGHEVVRWYLKDSADHLDEAESRKEAAAAARLEKFMVAALTPGPSPKPGRGEMSEGVHYSDLFEQYLPIADKPRRLLADWLPEYFIKTLDGTWRPPADDEERAQLAALRSYRQPAPHQALRQRAAGRASRPPSATGPPTSRTPRTGSASAAARGCTSWGARSTRRAGSISTGWARSRQVEVEEDYQVCVRRSG